MKKALCLLLLLSLCLCCLLACNSSDGICDYCEENEADPFYNENITTKERFEGKEICGRCFRDLVWMEEE